MIDDIFCKIVHKELPADIVWEDDEFLVINDIHPQAPVHVLIIPKQHLDAIHAVVDHAQLDILGKMLAVASQAAQKLSVTDKGYRLIVNQGANAGQLVPHLHMHLLAGKKLGPKIVSAVD